MEAKKIPLVHRELTGVILDAAIEVHRVLGPGLLESSYEECLCHELSLRRVPFKRQVALPLQYKGIRLEAGYRIDLVVDEKVIVELKAVEAIVPIHEAQLMTYLRLSGIRVGLLVNFNVPILRNGIVRRVV